MLDTDREMRAHVAQTLGFVMRTAEAMEPALRALAADLDDPLARANVLAALTAVRTVVTKAGVAQTMIRSAGSAAPDAP